MKNIFLFLLPFTLTLQVIGQDSETFAPPIFKLSDNVMESASFTNNKTIFNEVIYKQELKNVQGKNLKLTGTISLQNQIDQLEYVLIRIQVIANKTNAVIGNFLDHNFGVEGERTQETLTWNPSIAFKVPYDDDITIQVMFISLIRKDGQPGGKFKFVNSSLTVTR
jgi:hypothetical protein